MSSADILSNEAFQNLFHLDANDDKSVSNSNNNNLNKVLNDLIQYYSEVYMP